MHILILHNFSMLSPLCICSSTKAKSPEEVFVVAAADAVARINGKLT